jgi:hypothetical protein
VVEQLTDRSSACSASLVMVTSECGELGGWELVTCPKKKPPAHRRLVVPENSSGRNHMHHNTDIEIHKVCDYVVLSLSIDTCAMGWTKWTVGGLECDELVGVTWIAKRQECRIR